MWARQRPLPPPGLVSTHFPPAYAFGDRAYPDASEGLPCLWPVVSLSQWETPAGDQWAGSQGLYFPPKDHSSQRWPFSIAPSLASFR